MHYKIYLNNVLAFSDNPIWSPLTNILYFIHYLPENRISDYIPILPTAALSASGHRSDFIPLSLPAPQIFIHEL